MLYTVRHLELYNIYGKHTHTHTHKQVYKHTHSHFYTRHYPIKKGTIQAFKYILFPMPLVDDISSKHAHRMPADDCRSLSH